MTESLDARAKKVFDEAIELTGSRRAEFLDRACAGDPQLRRRIEALLAACEKEDVFLCDPTIGGDSGEAARRAEDQVGARIGPYTLLTVIGEGGFGSVYLAEQSAPVRRRVALKLIKLGMDTRAVVARFEQERQALALMDHPNIAKVFDAGVTTTGRPYFVMELVKGLPITTYCDSAQLGIPERLELFGQVCRAVQHAHNKGIIHRDLKPSNVLVGEEDGDGGKGGTKGRPLCRVIDFGIAKATRRSVTEKAAFTEARQMVGTPEYMSPEQAAGADGDCDVDTRTDVYSLGVLLYELLAGAPPFDPKRLRSAAWGELQRIIREDDPPAPSTRIAQGRESLASVASCRGVEPRRLGSLVRGELDWMVMRAIEKDRTRRYESPGNFAADIERYLSGQPIEAAPPTRGYRLRKAIRRHRLIATATALVAVSLLAGLGVSLWQARVAAHERDRALAAETKAVAARNDADKRRQETEQIAQFQETQLSDIDPELMGRRLRDRMVASAKEGMLRAGLPESRVTERQEQLARLLDDANPTDVALGALDENIFLRALKTAEEQFKDQPLVKASLLQTTADTLRTLGLLDRAVAPQAEALALRRRLLGDESLPTIASVYGTAALLLTQSRFSEAEPFYREVLASKTKVLGPEHFESVGALGDLGLVLQMQGKRKEAKPYFQELLEKSTRLFGPKHENTLQALNNMGGLLMDDGKPAEAEPYFRDAIERHRGVGNENDVSSLLWMSNLALSLEQQGKAAQAEPLYREALARSRHARGEDHPDTLLFASNLGFLLSTLGKHAEAETLSRETLQRRHAALGDDNPETMQSCHNLGVVLLSAGKAAEAEPLLRKALAWREQHLGMNSHLTAATRGKLVQALGTLGQFKNAEDLLLETERRLDAAGADAGPRQHRRSLEKLVEFYESWEKAVPAGPAAGQSTKWKAKLDAMPSDSTAHSSEH